MVKIDGDIAVNVRVRFEVLRKTPPFTIEERMEVQALQAKFWILAEQLERQIEEQLQSVVDDWGMEKETPALDILKAKFEQL